MSYHNYSFSYYTRDNEDVADEFAIEDDMTRNLKYGDAITWDAVLRDFISFLSGIYGYDIGAKVKFETLEDKLDRYRDENNLNSDWPWDDWEDEDDTEDSLIMKWDAEDDKGEKAPQV